MEKRGKNYIKYLVSHIVQFYMYIKLDKTERSMCAYVASYLIECKITYVHFVGTTAD